jgi:CHAT domain-containing protein
MKAGSASADGDFEKSVNILQASYEDSSIDFKSLGLLCTSYLELNLYDKFFDCHEKWIESGKKGEFFIFVGFTEPEEMIARQLPIRARAYLKLGDYEKALIDAQAVLNNIENEWVQPGEKVFLEGKSGYIYAEAGSAASIAIQAKVRLGDKTGFKKYLNWLEKPSTSDIKLITDVRNAQHAAALISLQQYREALNILQSNTDSFEQKMLDINGALLTPILATMQLGFGIDSENLMNFSELQHLSQTVPLLFMEAMSLQKTGQLQEAELAFDKLISMPILSQFGEIYWASYYAKSELLLARNDNKGAIKHLKLAIESIEIHRKALNSERSKIGFVGDKQIVYQLLVNSLIKQEKIEEAFEYIERSKSRALVDVLTEKSDFASDNEYLKEFDEHDYVLQTFSSSSVDNFNKATERRKASTLRLQKEQPQIASLSTVSFTSLQTIQSYLSNDEILLEYYSFGDDLYAVVINARQISIKTLNGTGLDDLVKQYRESILNYTSNEYVEYSEKLYSMLIEPIEDKITGKKLTIVPHGSLHYLPFSTLSKQSTFLIEQYELRILPSASVLPLISSRNTNESSLNLLALGNPDLGNSVYDLPAAATEVEAILLHKDNSKGLFRLEATETAVKSIGGTARILHIASHGEFNSNVPLKSRLLLAKDNKNDGELTLSEIYDLSLTTDLVVLSACETAVGNITSGDDIVGLTRGFFYAGASSVVSSLWVVDDNATAMLMKAFYQKKESVNSIKALQQAQLSVKQNYNEHPFFWAAFQIYGNAI